MFSLEHFSLEPFLKEAGPQSMNILLHWAVSPYHKKGVSSCSPSCCKAACISTSLSGKQFFIPCRCPGTGREYCRSGLCGKRLKDCPVLDTDVCVCVLCPVLDTATSSRSTTPYSCAPLKRSWYLGEWVRGENSPKGGKVVGNMRVNIKGRERNGEATPGATIGISL